MPYGVTPYMWGLGGYKRKEGEGLGGGQHHSQRIVLWKKRYLKEKRTGKGRREKGGRRNRCRSRRTRTGRTGRTTRGRTARRTARR